MIKIVLKGIMGEMEVAGKIYPGQVPMTPYEGMLDDTEIAAVLTYVRNSFGIMRRQYHLIWSKKSEKKSRISKTSGMLQNC